MTKKTSKLPKPKGLFSNSIFSNIKSIRENISLIIIVPTILGGLLQLYNLSNISPEYIRFFSISQVVPDGLLFIVIAISFIVSFEIMTQVAYILLKNSEKNKDKDDEEENKKSSKWTSLFVLILCVFMLIGSHRAGLLNLNFEYRFGGISFFFDVFLKILIFNIAFILVLFSLSSIYNILFKSYIEKNKSFFGVSELKKISKIYHLILIIGYLFFIIYMVNNTYKFTLKNIDYLTSDIMEKNNLFVRPSLLYYNDKYLFYEFYIEEKPEVLIYEFRELFNIEYTIIENKEFEEKLKVKRMNDSISQRKNMYLDKQIDSLRLFTRTSLDSIESYLEKRKKNEK